MERENDNLPSAALLPKCLKYTGLGQAEARSPKVHQDFLVGWQGLKYWTITGSWMGSGLVRTHVRHSDVACHHPKQGLLPVCHNGGTCLQDR